MRFFHRAALLATAILALSFPGSVAQAQVPRQITIGDAIAIALRQGFQARGAQGTRDAARARDHIFYSNYLPSLSIGGTAPSYTRSVTPITQPDGSILYRPVQQAQGTLTANIVQRVPWTNTTLTFSSALSQVQVSGNTSFRTWSSTPYSIGIVQPILRANTQHWDTWAQELRYLSAERKYLEAREDAANAAANAFFDLYSATVTLANATKNAATNDTLYTLNKGRYEVGKIGENDLLQSELALLRTRSAHEDAKLGHERMLSQFRIALNFPTGTPIALAVTPDVPTFEADTALAVAEARRNASGMSDAELAEVAADRAVSEARWNTGAGGTLSATYGYNASAPTAGEAYKNLLDARQMSLNVSIPVWQWGAHSAQIQAARADRETAKNTSALNRANLEQGARFAALQVGQARRSLVIAAKADTVATKRFEVAYNRYVIGKIAIDNLYLAQTEKDQALAAYVQALRGYWSAYYQLRKVTLYDFETGRPIR
jgi:outer membrane protein TolC